MRNKFEVIDTADPYYYKEDGINMLIWFKDIKHQVGQFELVVVDDNPLTGTSMVISNLEISRYGGGEKRLYYDYIPFDYLFTDETTPQVIVDIGGMPALCTSLDCGYSYEAPSAELTDMTVNEADLTVVITGTSLPDEIESVVIG